MNKQAKTLSLISLGLTIPEPPLPRAQEASQ